MLWNDQKWKIKKSSLTASVNTEPKFCFNISACCRFYYYFTNTWGWWECVFCWFVSQRDGTQQTAKSRSEQASRSSCHQVISQHAAGPFSLSHQSSSHFVTERWSGRTYCPPPPLLPDCCWCMRVCVCISMFVSCESVFVCTGSFTEKHGDHCSDVCWSVWSACDTVCIYSNRENKSSSKWIKGTAVIK